jgi:hypothetical protein
LYSKFIWHGRTQCVYHTSYECSYVKILAALCWVGLESAEPQTTVMSVAQ